MPRASIRLFIIILVLTTLYYIVPSTFYTSSPKPPRLLSSVDIAANGALWQDISTLLTAAKPFAPGIRKLPANGAPGFDPSNNSPLKDQTRTSHKTIGSLKDSHQVWVDGIKKDAENRLKLVYKEGTRGIVSTAGGKYLPTFLVSLRVLRAVGSKLPVELFLADESEYDARVCEEILPELNARCVILSEILTAAGNSLEIKTFQFKILSIIFSSFESVLFLDADNLPATDPELLFDSQAFTTYGMITWPDYWIRTASPKFYDIANVEKDKIPDIGVRAATESGQIIFNKRTHESVLWMSLYYNIYGPSHYYSLLCQGGPGEGDKETYIAAAEAAAVFEPSVSFYAVPRGVDTVGYWSGSGKNKDFHGVGMVQHFPLPDLELERRIASARYKAGKKFNDDKADWPQTGNIFIHEHNPKLNPVRLWMNDDQHPPLGPMSDPDTGRWHRIWSDNAADLNRNFGLHNPNATDSDENNDNKEVFDLEALVFKAGVCPTACSLALPVDGDVGLMATRKVRAELTKKKVFGFDISQACGVCNMFVAEMYGGGWREELQAIGVEVEAQIEVEDVKKEESEEKHDKSETKSNKTKGNSGLTDPKSTDATDAEKAMEEVPIQEPETRIEQETKENMKSDSPMVYSIPEIWNLKSEAAEKLRGDGLLKRRWQA